MPDDPPAMSLRAELSLRNQRFASSQGYLYECTDGPIPSIVFGRDDEGRHGNFHPAVYERICSNAMWARRLNKVHTASRRYRPRANWQWKELDCANSSDALLMNIFCHPAVMASTHVRTLLGSDWNEDAEFGVKPRTPLRNGGRDNTEVDMRVGDLLVEAKLTESDFQCANQSLIARYRDLESVFEVADLPMRDGKLSGYQLIRGTLAAYATSLSFSVFCDARRPDLIQAWYGILRAVRAADLRCRLKLLTWQELASVLPMNLQEFLAVKYGIFPAPYRDSALYPSHAHPNGLDQ
jgi:hypothetical protein